MNRMISAWDGHLVERCVPALLPKALVSAGFVIERIEPVVFSDMVLKPDGLANMMMLFMQQYAVGNGLVDEAEAVAWADEQRVLSDTRRFFFSLNHYVVSAWKGP